MKNDPRSISWYWWIVALAVVGGVFLNKDPSLKKWEAFKAEMERQGIPCDFKEVLSLEIPDDENFAHTPFLHPVFAFEWNEDFSEIKKGPSQEERAPL